ncbi:MAG: surface-adhesin E family protein [Planctomycetaceae bacterium]
MPDSIRWLRERTGNPRPPEASLPPNLSEGAFSFVRAAFRAARRKLPLTARHGRVIALIVVPPAVLLGFAGGQQSLVAAWLFPIKRELTLTLALSVFLYPGPFCRKSPAGKSPRKLWGLILSGVLLLSFPEAWGADWKYVGEGPLASYYYDAEDMVRQENGVRVWVKAVYSPEGRKVEAEKIGGDVRNLTDSRALEEINCRDKNHRAVALVVYSLEEKVVIADFQERGLDFVLPDPIRDGLYKRMCK